MRDGGPGAGSGMKSLVGIVKRSGCERAAAITARTLLTDLPSFLEVVMRK